MSGNDITAHASTTAFGVNRISIPMRCRNAPTGLRRESISSSTKPTAVGGNTRGSAPIASMIKPFVPARHDHAASASATGAITIVLIVAMLTVKSRMCGTAALAYLSPAASRGYDLVMTARRAAGRTRRRWRRRTVGAGIAGMSARRVVTSGRGAVAAAGRVLPAIVGRLHRVVGRRLAAAEARCFAGMDEQRRGAQRRPNLDRAFEYIDDRFSGRVDFNVVLRPAHGEQRAGRLHDARLGAGDLVEHRVNPSALDGEDDARCSAGELDVGRRENLEFRALRLGGDERVRKPAGVYAVAALRVRAFRGGRLLRRRFQRDGALGVLEAVTAPPRGRDGCPRGGGGPGGGWAGLLPPGPLRFLEKMQA